MSALQTFDFETNAVRVLMRDEVPWFVAVDICRALNIQNTAQAVASLDEDEKGLCSTYTLRGEQKVLCVTESGLYTIILRSREAVTAGTPAHRFRKWVTGEVLPAIRRTGRYEAPAMDLDDCDDIPSLRHDRMWGNSVAKVNAAGRFLGVVKDLFGIEAARELYNREKGLPKLKKFSAEAIEADPTSNPAGALRRLLRSAGGNGQTIGQMLTLAMRDHVAARRLSEYGVLAQTGPGKSYVAIANAHRFLASVFAGTPWQKEWRCAFLLLDGAEPARTKQSFGEVKTNAVYVPHVTILKFLNHAEAEILPP